MCAKGNRARMKARGAPPSAAARVRRAGDMARAARRALEEAMMRRSRIEESVADRPKEANGAEGPEPTRYGDWERNGLISDF